MPLPAVGSTWFAFDPRRRTRPLVVTVVATTSASIGLIAGALPCTFFTARESFRRHFYPTRDVWRAAVVVARAAARRHAAEARRTSSGRRTHRS